LYLALNQTTTIRWNVAQAVREYQRAGFDGIGVSLQKLIRFGADRAIAAVQASTLKVSTLGWAGGFTGVNHYSLDEAVEDARQALLWAGELGADALVIVSGPQSGHIRPHARRLVIEAMARLVDLATEVDVRLALQPMHPLYERDWSFLTGLDDALDIVTRFNHTHVGLAFGTYHLWQEPRLIEQIAEISPFISCVQLSDWREPPRGENDRLIPGDGPIPHRDVIAALDAAGYHGPLEVEVWSRDLWKTDHRSLIRQCRRQAASLIPTPANTH